MEQIATRLSVGVGQVEHALKSFYRKPNSGRAGKYEWQLKRLSERVKEVDKWLLQDQTLSVLSEVKGLVLSMPQQEVQELMDWIQSRVDRHDSSALAEFGRRCGFEVESSV